MGRSIADSGRRKSRAVDKERLRLILTLDRTSLSPRLIDILKNDIRQTISRYLVIDEENFEVSLNNSSGNIALVIAVPVITVRRGVPSAS